MMIATDMETIFPGKTDRDLYKMALYIYRKSFKSPLNTRIIGDLVQNAILTVWNNRDVYDEEKGSVNSWLYSVMFNAMRQEVVQHKNKVVYSPKKGSDDLDRFASDETNDTICTATEECPLVVMLGEGYLDSFDHLDGEIRRNEYGLTDIQHAAIVSALDGNTMVTHSEEAGVSKQSAATRLTRAIEVVKYRREHGKDAELPGKTVYRFYNKDREVVSTYSMTKLAKANGLNNSALSAVHRGELHQHRGWKKA